MTADVPPHARPALSPGYRFQWEAAQDAYVLLYPEGMVTLNESAAEVLRRCDGERTVQGVIDDLQAAFPGAELDEDVKEFLAQARERGWIRVE